LEVQVANQDTSVILHSFVMIAPRMMHQQDMADSLWWFALWGPCIDPWINMVSIQICQIFLRLLKIAFACNVCDVAFLHATNAMSHTLHTLHTLHAKKKPYVYDCPSS
jgi:hypothetical protein